ncbi:hypothetical protein EIKCOROL_01568 [Eikenella corrodens ATCC 23834]|uniref:Uncharacterized protein n=1 Tax=Eikenella corrodens ATCC 23834 TaxID=546274 RepID=C0DW22_EIKCO|nr:hypothetical protein EIKCOROL_01568 [Eikenella corrodens ATCC 23834]
MRYNPPRRAINRAECRKLGRIAAFHFSGSPLLINLILKKGTTQ